MVCCRESIGLDAVLRFFSSSSLVGSYTVHGGEGLGLVQDAIDQHLVGGRVATFCAIPFVAQPLEPGRPLTHEKHGGSVALFQCL
jgi:hypothetical protein